MRARMFVVTGVTRRTDPFTMAIGSTNDPPSGSSGLTPKPHRYGSRWA